MTTENQRAADVIAAFLPVPTSGFYEPGWELNDASDLLDALADAGLIVVSDASDGCINDHPVELSTVRYVATENQCAGCAEATGDV